ncbi:MAG: LCP family protein [Clostridia bacterium]|nr:LCP family protein [Clostridia bacterium]
MRKNHTFKTEKEAKHGNIIRFVTAFVIFALVFGGISALVVIRNNEITPQGFFSKDKTEKTESGSDGTKLSGSANIMIYSADSETNELFFLAVIKADMSEQTFKVYPIDTDGTYNGSSYSDILSKSGAKTLVNAVAANRSIQIDKYIASNSETFALAINYMGGLEYNVTNRIEYRSDNFTLILTQGKQTIKGETLIKYFRYCKTLGITGLKTQGELICAMLDNYINSDNVENGMDIYRKVLSKLETASDISYIEAANTMPILEQLCKSDKRVPSTVVMTTQ